LWLRICDENDHKVTAKDFSDDLAYDAPKNPVFSMSVEFVMRRLIQGGEYLECNL
jgi:hypothetical protein